MDMKTKIYKEGEGDLSYLKEKTIAIIGYGNQGRAQALNLRDSGLKVIIGNRRDEYFTRAKKDGFESFAVGVAVKKAEIIILLLPDEIIPDIFDKDIAPNLNTHSCLVFAHGYVITYETINPPKEVDIILIAPRMIGVGVREKYLRKEGFYSFVAIHQDVTGEAKKIMLALCEGLGTLRKGAVELTFKQETNLDLFNEQAFGPAFGRVLLSSIFTLIDAGYPPEAVLIEMYLSGEMEYTYEKFRTIGLVEQVNFHSHTSQYGSMSRGIKFLNLPVKKIQKNILKNIESGDFAREWEKPASKIKFRFLKFFATKTRIRRLEKKVRKELDLVNVDYFNNNYNDYNKNRLSDEMKRELEDYNLLFEEF